MPTVRAVSAVLAVGVTLVAAACGSDDEAATKAPAVSPEQAAACAELATAECARKQACFKTVGAQWLADCATIAARECETVFLRDGVTQTPERVHSCAAAMPSAVCGRYTNVVGIAECEPPPGALGDNAPCVESYQCASDQCVPTGNVGCNRCVPASSRTQPLGADCDVLDGVGCAEGICYGGVCKLSVQPGEACGDTTYCAGSLPCLDGVCSSALEPGAACTEAGSCIWDYECKDGICKYASLASGLPVGSNCGFEEFKKPLGCAAGLYCHGPKDGLGKCTLDRATGQSCSLKNVFEKDPCVQGLKCISGSCQRELQPRCN